MDEWIKVVILGIVEGITEFLPISSTGHLIVASALLDFKNALDGTFEIFIQLGAVVAVIGFYREDILIQVRDVRHDAGVRHFWATIVVASIPAAIMGFALRDWIKDTLFTPEVVAVSLILGGLAFLRIEQQQRPAADTAHLTDVTFRQAIIVGLAQTLALIPGVSRSGASILGGLYCGMSRPLATAYSFYLSIPVLGGATIFSLLLSLDEMTGEDVFYLTLGAIVSFIVAWFAIGWLLRYVARRDFVLFGYYRIIVGMLILLLVIVEVI